MQLQKDREQLAAAGIRVVGISYDPVETLAQFARQAKVDFPLLSDGDSKVIDAYGVRNHEARGKQAGIPYPTTMVVDPTGTIRAKLPGTVPRRHTTAQLVEVARQLKSE